MENFLMMVKKEYGNRVRKPISIEFGEKEHFLSEGQIIESHSNLKGLITYINPDFESFTGFLKDELLGKPMGLIRYSARLQTTLHEYLQFTREGNILKWTVKNRTKDGGFYWVDERISAMYENQRHVGYRALQFRPDTKEIQKVRYLKSTRKLSYHVRRHPLGRPKVNGLDLV